jgi:hypothetical protein
MIQNISSSQLRKAAAIKDRIDALQTELNKIFASSGVLKETPAPRQKRKISAAGKARIAEAQRKRWAKQKAGKN